MRSGKTVFHALAITIPGLAILALTGLALDHDGRPSSTLAARQPDHIPPSADYRKPEASGRLQETYGARPLTFEANQGQTDTRVKFLARGNGYTVFLTPREAILALRIPQANSAAPRQPLSGQKKATTALRIKLAGANPTPLLTALEKQASRSGYFTGNDPGNWHAHVPHYARIKYQDIYAGVDWVFYGNQRELEYDFVVAPGTDPGKITLTYDSWPPPRLNIDSRGDLLLHTPGGTLRQHRPRIYQVIAGVKKDVPGHYVLRDKTAIGFQIAGYDTGKPLIIDPVLSYSSYLGGSDSDTARAIAVDSNGNTYIAGGTSSIDFPAQGTTSSFSGNSDAFVTKLDSGGGLVYSTYLGGGGIDSADGIAVDQSGSVYIAGNTNSGNFPTLSAYQATAPANINAFVTKLDSGGTLAYSTYLGGDSNDLGNAIAVDASGNAYVTGSTQSTDFPTLNPYQSTKRSDCINPTDTEAFVAKLSTMGAALIYSTYLGGGRNDEGHGIAVDQAGSAYVTGHTASAQGTTQCGTSANPFPTKNAVQSLNAGGDDAFVTKLNISGSALEYSTYLGGSSGERGAAIALDAAGGVYVTGYTRSTNFPVTAAAFQTRFGGDEDAFVAKLDTTRPALAYSSYLGGNKNDFGNDIAVTPDGNNTYLTGTTSSTDFPLANPTQPVFGGGLSDAFIARLNATGSVPVYSTYLGGQGNDEGNGIALDASRALYVTGTTLSTDFPVTAGAYQPRNNGLGDAFVTKISASGAADLAVTKTATPNPVTAGSQLTYTITVTNNGPDAATGMTLRDTLPAQVTLVSVMPSQGSCKGAGRIVSCTLGTINNRGNINVNIIVIPASAGTLSNTTMVMANEDDLDPANSRTTIASTVNAAPPGGGGAVSPGGGGGGCFIATAAYGSYLHPHVQALREFRDEVLMKHRAGRAFIALYYRYSPPIAAFIARHEGLKIATRALLTPIVYAVTYPVAAGMISIGMLCLAGYKMKHRKTTANG